MSPQEVEYLPAQPSELPLEDDVLSYTHAKRKTLIEELFKNGVPTDVEVAKLALSALKDMDMSALTRKKIKTEEKANANQEAASQIITQLLMNSELAGVYSGKNITNREVPVLPDSIPDPILVGGETEIHAIEESIDSFLTKFIDE